VKRKENEGGKIGRIKERRWKRKRAVLFERHIQGRKQHSR